MKKFLLINILLMVFFADAYSQLKVHTREFAKDPDSSPLLPRTKVTIDEFRKDAPKDVKAELDRGVYRGKIEVIRAVGTEDAQFSYKSTTLDGKTTISTPEPIQITEDANAIISGSVLYRENKKLEIRLSLYVPKIVSKKGSAVADTIYMPNAKNTIIKRKSLNFIEEEEKAARMIRRMTRRLVGQGLLTTQAEYAVTGAGLVLTGIGTALYINSDNRYKVYEDNRYELHPKFAEFSDSENWRQAYFDDLKRKERLSFITGGIGLAMTAFGTYEIMLRRKSKNKVYGYLVDDDLSFEDPKSRHTLTIGSDINYNPITTQTDPQLKLTYRF